MKHILGIDPGKTGGLALLTHDGDLVQVWDQPETPEAAADLFLDIRYGKDLIGALESVHARGSFSARGTASAQANFSLGWSLGGWRYLLAGFQVPYHLVRPQEWQKLIDTPKPKGPKDSKPGKSALKRWVSGYATRLWPNGEFRGPKGGVLDGRSDAAVIAECVRRKVIGGAV